MDEADLQRALGVKVREPAVVVQFDKTHDWWQIGEYDRNTWKQTCLCYS